MIAISPETHLEAITRLTPRTRIDILRPAHQYLSRHLDRLRVCVRQMTLRPSLEFDSDEPINRLQAESRRFETIRNVSSEIGRTRSLLLFAMSS
jgi:hypothetical protein